MEIIDLSVPITDGLETWPGDVPVRLWRHQALASGSPNTSGITLGSHTGTHLDAPFHWLKDGATADRVPLGALVGRGRVVDLRGRVLDGAVSLVALREAAGGTEPGERLLLLTGWRGQVADDDYPALSREAVEWLVARDPALVGVDTPSVDSAHAGYAHELLLGAGIPVIELLVNLERLLGDSFLLAALPLAVVGLDGAPVRAVAMRERGDRGPERP